MYALCRLPNRLDKILPRLVHRSTCPRVRMVGVRKRACQSHEGGGFVHHGLVFVGSTAPPSWSRMQSANPGPCETTGSFVRRCGRGTPVERVDYCLSNRRRMNPNLRSTPTVTCGPYLANHHSLTALCIGDDGMVKRSTIVTGAVAYRGLNTVRSCDAGLHL